MNEVQIEAARIRMCAAVATAMRYAHKQMTIGSPHPEHWERASEHIADLLKSTLFAAAPETRVVIKNGKSCGAGKYKFVIDPLDRLRSAQAGCGTATILVGLFDNDDTLIASVIGEPSLGRLWSSASHTHKTTLQIVTYTIEGASLGSERLVTVWDGALEHNGTVFLDKIAAIRGDTEYITSESGMSMVILRLEKSGARIQMTGSGGLNTALVANGGHGVAGSIGFALGGEWDACGALLVIGAGGVARGYKHVDGKFVERGALCPKDYDVLITANNTQTLDALSRCVEPRQH